MLNYKDRRNIKQMFILPLIITFDKLFDFSSAQFL